MKHHRTTAVVLLAAAVITAATGCGTNTTDAGTKNSATPATPADSFASLTAAQIELKTRKATASVTSLRLNGTVFADGQSADINIALDAKGNCTGKIAPEGIGTIDVVKNGHTVYVKGDERFWRTSLSTDKKNAIPRKQADALVAKFQDRWIKANKEMAKTMGTKVCDLAEFTKILVPDGGLDPNFTRGADTTEDGQPIAVIYEREDASDAVTTIHVAKKGKPYALRIQTTGGTEPADLYLSDFNQPVNATPPPADQVLDPNTVTV
ncbi:hypothetical protein [Streptomyces sp. NPDC046385]|uniref:hypothetical protein n=1 Tax=Streptomyces sp. NPDC046385 TaxID=3154918 RepID=UPI0034037757